jgi:CRP/FNR family transcriptional regulator
MVGIQEKVRSEEITAPSGGRTEFALPEIEQREIDQIGYRIAAPPKTTIFTQGEPTVAIYILIRGIAALYKMAGGKRRQIVGFALPGDFLNLSFDDRHSCSVDAISEVAAYRYPTQTFLSYLHAHLTTMHRMLEITLQRLNAAHEHTVLLGRATAEERLLEFIIAWRARIGRKDALANFVPLPLSRKDIANYLGLTIETVSRALGKLEREKVLRVIPEGLQLMGPAERPLLFERSYRAAAPVTEAIRLSCSSPADI